MRASRVWRWRIARHSMVPGDLIRMVLEQVEGVVLCITRAAEEDLDLRHLHLVGGKIPVEEDWAPFTPLVHLNLNHLLLMHHLLLL